MKKMHLKKHRNKKNKIINKILFVLILLIISIIYIFKIFNEKALPQLISYSELETTKIVSSIVNNTITRDIAKNTNMDDLFTILKDSNGSIKSIDFNSSKINNILADTTRSVEQNLRYLESGNIDELDLTNIILSNYDKEKIKKGIIYELPSGIIFDNVLLRNILPKIPIKMNLIGNVFSEIYTDIESYGINNALIKININVEAEVKILLPFVSSREKIETNIPLAIKIIEGDVPSYYFDGYQNLSSISEKSSI